MTTQHSLHRNTGDGEGIVEIEGGGFRIPSFTDPSKAYIVHPESRFCSCDRHRFTGRCEKHVQLAKAIQECRRLRFGSKIAEARVTELAKAIYAPVRSGEHFVDSYKLLLDTLASRHATEGMARAAFKRHGRVLLLHERRAA